MTSDLLQDKHAAGRHHGNHIDNLLGETLGFKGCPQVRGEDGDKRGEGGLREVEKAEE